MPTRLKTAPVKIDRDSYDALDRFRVTHRLSFTDAVKAAVRLAVAAPKEKAERVAKAVYAERVGVSESRARRAATATA